MKKLLLLMVVVMICAVHGFAQNKTITGKVTDRETNQPIAGATILIVGTNYAAQTNQLGEYQLELKQEVASISYSSIGYATQIIKFQNQNNIDVALISSAANLEEVLVVGYGTQIKKDLTGSVASVKMSDLQDVPLQTMESALQGRASGVFINSGSGKLGQALQIRVRGTSSISAGNQPLFVIDGVPIISSDFGTYDEPSNPLAAISPDDIESMEVLKDAASAAIYGARASNGVVLISTKKGKAGRTNIDVGYYAGYSNPTKKGEFLNADQYRQLLTESATNASLIGAGNRFADMNEFWEYWGESDDWNNNYNSNWVNETFRTGNIQQISGSMNGGDSKTRFLASGSYNDNKGILVGNRFARTSGRLSLDHSANNWLDVGGTINVNKADNYRVSSDNSFSNPQQLNALPPIQPIRINGELNRYTIYYNNLIELEDSNNTSSTYRTFGTAYANARISPNLTFRSEYGMDFQNLEEDLYAGVRTELGSSGGYGFSYQARSINFNTNNTLTYRQVFNDLHELSLMGGMSYQEGQFRTTTAEGEGFPSDRFKKITSAAVKSDASSTESDFSFLSYLARANYKFSDKYLLDGSIRVDGSSRFGKENKYGFFPAAGLGWLISEESFLQGNQTLNFLKLRASLGKTGNAEIGNYRWRTLYGGANYAGTAGTVPIQLGDQSLTWENTLSSNIGLDFGLINDRLSGSIEGYYKKTTDLLLDAPIVSTSGYQTIYRNIGDMENKGLEITLNSKNLVGEFKWSTSFNISFNQNKVLKLVNGQAIYDGGRYLGRVEEGQPFGVFYGVAYAGVNPDNGDALFYLDETRSATTNDYSEAGLQHLGSPHAKFFGGFGNKFSYKNWDLDIQTQFVSGNKIYNAAGGFQSTNGDYLDNQTIDQMNYWTETNRYTDIPQPRFYDENGTNPSSRYIQDGSYFRIKNLVLSYALPAAIANKYAMQRARLFITGTNLLTLTKYNGYDPEISTAFVDGYQIGTDFYTSPQAKTITFGINIGF
ncbi:SusC/RagA family TonB-linked outer membrane protein [Sphingobacterium sp. HJSM2_6]|uniref:SusC/RagA family TonB-linked outer membrane protein n=1 Tax=Sphingobacterium sp. HJSM2_6 TaxID=3366264 RepID=UPI003BC616EC